MKAESHQLSPVPRHEAAPVKIVTEGGERCGGRGGCGQWYGDMGGQARGQSQGQEAKFGLWLCNCVNLTKPLRLNLPVMPSMVRSYKK